MSGDQNFITPIMANPEYVTQLGNNAYGKPATALNILRETVMGHELFDKAFSTYARRWEFKHPTPDDFFRTMEDASAVDLDWFWRGWFFSTDYVDIELKGVKKLYVTSTPTKKAKDFAAERGINLEQNPSLVYTISEDDEDFDPTMKSQNFMQSATTLQEYIANNNDRIINTDISNPKYLYEVTFAKPGGLVMPLIVEYTYADGTKEEVRYPAQIWAKSNSEVTKVLLTDKELTNVRIDPKLETADIDVTNNSWPKNETESKFDKFKSQIKN
jgi:hypothetical protein